MSNQDESADSRSSIQVLARASDILRILHGYPEGLSQTQIGSKVDLARSTVSRLLVALEAEGFVMSSGPRGRYRLGPELVRLASSARRNAWLDLHPLLVEFSYEIGETVDLSVLEGERAVFVDQVVADNRLRAVSAVGDSFALHASANGKAMLAAMPESDVRRVLNSRLEDFTKNTLRTPSALRAEIERIKAANGIAYDREEQSIGVCAVGAVIRTLDHDLLALSVPLPRQRFVGREDALRNAVLGFVNRAEKWIALNR